MQMKAKPKAGISLFALILMFLGLPSFLGWIGLRQVWREREEVRRTKLERRLEDVLASFDRYVNSDLVMERLLRRLEEMAFAHRSGDPMARLRKLLPWFHRALPGCFEFTVLNGDGKVVQDLCDGPTPRVILQKLFVAASENQRGRPQTWRLDEPLIRSLLGPLTPAKGFVPSRLLPANSSDHNRLLYLSQPRSRGMLIVRVTQLPSWTGMGLRLHWKRLHLPRGLKVVLIDRQKYSGSKNRETERNALRNSLAGKSWKGRLLKDWRVLTTRYQIMGLAFLPREKRLEKDKQWTLRAGIFGWVGVSLFLWLGYRIGRIPAPSVRIGMIAAFAYSAGIPLLMLGGTARVWLQERRQVLEDEVHRNTGRAMQTFDSRYPQRLRVYSNNLTVAMVGIVCPAGAPGKIISEKLIKASRVLHWDLCRVYDQGGHVIVNDEANAVFGRMSEAFDMMNNGLTYILRMLRDGKANGVVPKDDDLDALYGKLLPQLGWISQLELSGVNYLVYLHPIFDSARIPQYMVNVVWTSQRMQQEFLRNELQPFSRQLDSTDLLAWNSEQHSLSLPRNFRYRAMVAPFLPQIRSQSRESRMRLDRPDGALLLTGIRGAFLDGFSLVAVTSDRTIRAELNLLAWKLGAASVLLLLVSVTIGMVVARAFLEPVRWLATGIEALAERRFDARVPVSARDELGNLSEAFNEMMEGLADLEVARTVQEALFPDIPLSVGGWEIFGRCCSAAEIGGDYFDYVALDDHRLLLIIGDVSGHGVSAALVMAMAKALTADAGERITPMEILAALNSVFGQVLQGRKTMSCLVGVFDSTEGRLSVCNGGHCFPYLIRDGKALQLKVAGMLIGMGRRWRPGVSREFILQPGDCLVGYTDALYEACDRHTGVPIGFGRLEEALPGLVRRRARETEAAIRDWHTSGTASERPDDDLTLLVLQSSVESDLPSSVTVPALVRPFEGGRV